MALSSIVATGASQLGTEYKYLEKEGEITDVTWKEWTFVEEERN